MVSYPSINIIHIPILQSKAGVQITWGYSWNNKQLIHTSGKMYNINLVTIWWRPHFKGLHPTTLFPHHHLVSFHTAGDEQRMNRLDGVSSKVQRYWADQLCAVMGFMFNVSLKLGLIPWLWKTVPKIKHPKSLSTITLHLVTILERLVFTHLCLVV